MEFTKDEYLVSSALLSLRSYSPDRGFGLPFTWGRRKRRSIEDLSRLVHTMRTNSKKKKKEEKNAPVTAIFPQTPVQDEAVLIASRKSSSPEPSIANLPICTESCGPKQPRINKRKTPMKKSGTKLKMPEELKSAPDDSILPDALLETEINRENQLQNKVLTVKFVLKERGEELISRVSTQMEHISTVDHKILAGQLLHQSPLTVPTINLGLITSKEAAALARQKRIQICREKKHKCQMPRKIA